MKITLTGTANQQIKAMLKNEEGDDLFVRVGVGGSACSGLTYGMGFDDKMIAGDISLNMAGLKVVVDKNSAPLLDGVTIDYHQDRAGSGFTIDNPTATACCCGRSAETDEQTGETVKSCNC